MLQLTHQSSQMNKYFLKTANIWVTNRHIHSHSHTSTNLWKAVSEFPCKLYTPSLSSKPSRRASQSTPWSVHPGALPQRRGSELLLVNYRVIHHPAVTDWPPGPFPPSPHRFSLGDHKADQLHRVRGRGPAQLERPLLLSSPGGSRESPTPLPCLSPSHGHFPPAPHRTSFSAFP